MKKTELAYVAGILDGEGSIQIQRVARKHFTYCRLALNVASSNPEVLEWLKEKCEGNIYARRPACTSECDIVHVHKRKDSFAWYLTGARASKLLQSLLRYMIIKRDEAEEALLLCGEKGSYRSYVSAA